MVPDYYARLGVDPRADRAEIEAALKRMQPAWSMGTRNPKTRHANQLYLDEIPALRKALLSDPASRAAYDAELAMVQVAERDQKLDLLLRRVNLRAAKGGLTAPDRRLLGDEATKLGLSEDDLLRLTRPIPDLVEAVAIDDDSELDVDPPADVLDPSTRRQIRVALDHLGCRDLYDALGVTRDAPWLVHRGPRRRRTPALDEEGPGHRREDRLARSHHACPVAPDFGQDSGDVRSDPGPGDRRVVRGPGRIRPQGIEPARPGHPGRPWSKKPPRSGSHPSGPIACSGGSAGA